jgi:3-deoxy-D-manno-octulosonic-acid transferase
MFFNVVYGLLLIALSPLLIVSAIRHGKYRQGWRQKLLGHVEVPTANGPRFWFHAVSVGEINLLQGLIKQLLIEVPSADIIVSTTTSTGFALAQKRFPPERVIYCPLDFTWAVRKALTAIRPDCIVLAELEVWPNWIRAATKDEVPVVVVNGRLSDRSFRGYQRLDFWLRPTFQRLRLVAAQTPTYAYRFQQLGTPSDAVHVTGSTKFDDAPLSRDSHVIREFRTLVGLPAVAQGDSSTETLQSEELQVFIAGSTQSGEEAIVLDVYRRLSAKYPKLRLMIVPRHAERFEEVAQLITTSGFACRRRSQLQVPRPSWPSEDVVLVDTIGELRSWWGLADIAFVGGSLGSRGGQNMLEPAGYGAAVCFGPNTQNFRDIVSELTKHQGAVVVADANELEAFVDKMIQFPQQGVRLGEAAQKVIASHQGATRRTIRLLTQLVSQHVPATYSDHNHSQ